MHYGSDTVMDLSTGGDIPKIRQAIIETSPVPVGTVPIYEALSRVKRTEDLSVELMLEVRLREALAPILARATDSLVRDARKELTAAMRDIVARAIAKEVGRREER